MKILSFAQFRAQLAEVTKQVGAFVEAHPDVPAAVSIRDQLAYADELTSQGAPLTEVQVKNLSIGMLAAKYIETPDLDLAKQIYDVEDFLETFRG